MSDMWKNWEGQVADHKYQLLRFLGSTDHSAAFLAEFHDPEPRQAAIKFVSADISGKEQQLEAWKDAAQLSHPNLLRIYGSGSCKIDDMDLLYVATEYAEENLAQVLPHRALTTEETSEMLNAVVNVLLFLHGKGLVHGHIKPSNVLASTDHLKLSSDTIVSAGEVREMRRERSAYDAPELPTVPCTAAADIWSLGVTLVEACTQQPAVLPYNERAEPIVPSTMPEKFLEIARETLRRDPNARWSTAKIAEHLNPPPLAVKAAAAAAGTNAPAPVASAGASTAPAAVAPAPIQAPPAISPLDVPLSKERALPLNKLPHAPAGRHEPALPPLRTDSAKGQTVELPNYVLPLFACALGVIALIVLFFVLHPRTRPEVSASASISNSRATAVTPSNAAKAPPSPAPVAKVPVRQATPANVPQKPSASTAPAQLTASAATDANAATAPPTHTGDATRKLRSDADHGEALDQVTPQASPKALATIHGTVRVVVKVQVDPAGNVSDATLDNPGPSHYFADLALKAARQWVFTPPDADGHSVASQWLIEFGFTNEGAKASASQLEP
ncbi:MAG TPA: TonB family protein [Candidatus Eremiobacteraceae bacterium]|nr:TonB family protein [Candidatus Eremiobacteraceae bacterium]